MLILIIVMHMKLIFGIVMFSFMYYSPVNIQLCTRGFSDVETSISQIVFFSKDLPDDLMHNEHFFLFSLICYQEASSTSTCRKRLVRIEYPGAHLTGKCTVTIQHNLFLMWLLNQLQFLWMTSPRYHFVILPAPTLLFRKGVGLEG